MEIRWLGHNSKPKVDKVWGWGTTDNHYFIVYGPVGRSLQFELFSKESLGPNKAPSLREFAEHVTEQIKRKQKNGYKKVEDADAVWPNFVSVVGQWITYRILSDAKNKR